MDRIKKDKGLFALNLVLKFDEVSVTWDSLGYYLCSQRNKDFFCICQIYFLRITESKRMKTFKFKQLVYILSEIYYGLFLIHVITHQIRSVAQSCPTLCDPMNCSTPGLPVHHQLLEFTQTHVHQVSDAIQPSHPLSSPSPLAPNPSQYQSLFQWVNSSHEVAKVLEFQL